MRNRSLIFMAGVTVLVALVVSTLGNPAVLTHRRTAFRGGGGEVVTDDFAWAAAGTNPISDGENWALRLNTINTVNSGTAGASPGTTTDFSGAYYDAGAATLNQRVEVTLTAVNTGGFLGPAVRVQTGANSWYHCVYDGTTLVLGKVIAGTNTELASSTPGYSASVILSLDVTDSGAATRLTVQADTGGGFANVTGMVSIDPGTYLGAGHGGLAGYDDNPGTYTRLWKWYNL